MNASLRKVHRGLVVVLGGVTLAFVTLAIRSRPVRASLLSSAPAEIAALQVPSAPQLSDAEISFTTDQGALRFRVGVHTGERLLEVSADSTFAEPDCLLYATAESAPPATRDALPAGIRLLGSVRAGAVTSAVLKSGERTILAYGLARRTILATVALSSVAQSSVAPSGDEAPR